MTKKDLPSSIFRHIDDMTKEELRAVIKEYQILVEKEMVLISRLSKTVNSKEGRRENR
jgi:hypothetical protein